MQSLSKKIDSYLIDLVWSLWTELGVAGVKRQHQHCLIGLEELILLTAVIADLDPRVRDEALDWCSRYHYFVSISRLKTLMKHLGDYVSHPFALFAGILNSVSKANWPCALKIIPLKFKPSHKSKPPQCELPALLGLRLRALFGVGARADLMTFFLTQEGNTFTATDTTEIGYSKRSLIDLLDAFVQAGFFSVFTTQNQHNYSFIKRSQMANLLGEIPKITPPWREMLEVLLPLRSCIQEVEKKSIATQMIEIRNTLAKMENKLRKLNLSPPPIQSNFTLYLESFSNWILKTLKLWAEGNFENNQRDYT